MNKKENKTENKTEHKIDGSQKLKDITHLKELPATAFDTDAGSKPISAFIEKYNAGLIDYPSMQRGEVWTDKDQSELIESLIRGIPIPPVYINRCTKDDGKVWEVLDGRQRITALMDFFVENLVHINKNLPKDYENLFNYRYGDIEETNPLFAGKFTSLQLPVIWMDNAPDELKKEFFQKLNKSGKALTAGELAHSSLDPAKGYMVSLLKTPFYEKNVQITSRFAQYVPASKIVHFIYKSLQKDKTFEYNPLELNGWKNRISRNAGNIQTDLDNLHASRNEQFHTCLETEVERVCTLINEIFGDLEIECPNSKLVTNMIISLLILEDKSNATAMGHDELRKAFKGLVELWNAGRSPHLRQKMRTELNNITNDEAVWINECDKLESMSKTSLADVLENLRNDVYSNYV